MKLKIASPGKRILAGLVDVLISWTIWLVFIYQIASAHNFTELLDAVLVFVVVGFILLPQIIMLFHIWMISTFGGGPGKLLTGLEVVRPDGKRLTFWRAVFRNYLGYLVSGSFFWLGFIWILIDKEHRAWHDFVADTYVVEKRSWGAIVGVVVAFILLIGLFVLIGGIFDGFRQNSPAYSGAVQEFFDQMKTTPKTTSVTTTTETKKLEALTIQAMAVYKFGLCDGVGSCAMSLLTADGKRLAVDFAFPKNSCKEAGLYDKSIVMGDQVEVYGQVLADPSTVHLTLCGDSGYYLRRLTVPVGTVREGSSSYSSVGTSAPVPVKVGN